MTTGTLRERGCEIAKCERGRERMSADLTRHVIDSKTEGPATYQHCKERKGSHERWLSSLMFL